MDVLDAIVARRSTGRLTEPAPSAGDLDVILRAACAAPDHDTLRPWRFVVLEGDAKVRFGRVLADAYVARCTETGIDPVPAKVEKERTKLGRAPLVVVAGAAIVHVANVPAAEQVSAVAAACQNALLAATALGYGSMWRTGDPAYDPRVKAAAGLAAGDAIVGFLYLGSFRVDAERLPPNEPTTAGIVTRWG